MEQIVNLITSNSMAVVIIAYFIFKDYKQTNQIINVLGEVKEILVVLKEKYTGDPNEIHG